MEDVLDEVVSSEDLQVSTFEMLCDSPLALFDIIVMIFQPSICPVEVRESVP